jgi:hypothetical protein
LGLGHVVGQLDLLTHIKYVIEKDLCNEVDPKCHVKPDWMHRESCIMSSSAELKNDAIEDRANYLVLENRHR